MNPLKLLGLEDDADERSIKRQYAKLLKINRPDDDPAAFQRLREAYESALQRARNRASEGDDFDAPTATLECALETAVVSHPPPAASLATPIAPAVDARRLAHQAAKALVGQTTAQNIEQQHQYAKDQDCEYDFQQQLLQRCLDEQQANAELVKQAAAHLRWLTPWQSLRITADDEWNLTQRLLETEHTHLENLLINNEERALLGVLENLSKQPWLESLERKNQFQQWTMLFLHNQKTWSTALFDRICTLFGWDDRKGIFPEPEFMWRQLIDRCEKYAYFDHWQRLVASGKTDSVEEKAAFMVLSSARKLDRIRLARYCNADVWTNCEYLCSIIKNRYPEMQERFAHADLESWRQLQVEPTNLIVWTWFGWLLFTAFFMLPELAAQENLDVTVAAVTLLTYPFSMTVACVMFMLVWRPISRALEDADEWLSDWVLPAWVHWPASQALVLRHGIPLVITGAVISKQGQTALMCYTLLMLTWIFLSPYRYPQICAQVREAVKAFIRANEGRLYLSAAVIGLFTAWVIIFPPVRHDVRATYTAPLVATAGQLDCRSQQAMELMDKECKNSIMPERCANDTLEQKLSQCWRIRTRLQGAMDRQQPQQP